MKGKRVVIVGGVAGGASCAARLRRQDEHAQIVILERGAHVSFANCGLPYYVGGIITNRDDLLVSDATKFREWFAIEVRTRNEVVAVDREAREVTVRDLDGARTYREPYDVLVLAPGAAPLKPPIPGIESDGVFAVRDLADADHIVAWLTGRIVKSAVVVGGGFIGLEMAENLRHRGLDVTVREVAAQLLPPLDPEIVAPLVQHLEEHGVRVRLGDGVARFEAAAGGGINVVAASGESDQADLVVIALGVRPESRLAALAGLEIGPRGGIVVDESMRTSAPDIYAVGDAVQVHDVVLGTETLVPLAGPANRQGRLAADAISGRPARFRGTQGTAVVQVFDVTVALTGASEKSLARERIPFEKAYVHPASHAAYYPGAQPMTIKLLFAPDSGKLLGAQAIGGEGVARRIDVLAMALQMHATVFDLEEAELCYSPQHGSAKDAVNMAGFVAANHLRGDAPLVHWERLAETKVPGGPLVVDVRGVSERAASAPVPGSVNIPLPELRARLRELPCEREIWVHCGVGKRSHLATRILMQNGFRVRNLSGGYRQWSRGAIKPAARP